MTRRLDGSLFYPSGLDEVKELRPPPCREIADDTWREIEDDYKNQLHMNMYVGICRHLHARMHRKTKAKSYM